MVDHHDIGSVWDVLGSKPGARNEVAVAPLGNSTPAGALMAGVDSFGNRHLMVPLLPGEAFSPSTAGKSLHLVRLDHGGLSYASAVCLSRELDDVFARFAREMVDGLTFEVTPARSMREALERWKLLLSNSGRAGVLSEEEQLGLFGELLLLRKVLKIAGNGDISCWKGPDMHQHDFRWPGHALEVKASRARNGRRLRISSLEQLTAPADCTLHLWFVRLEDDPAAESLLDLIREIRTACLDPNSFVNLIESIGYNSLFDDEYAKLRCRVIETRTYDVLDPAFPRITAASFVSGNAPQRVEQVTYVADVSGESPSPAENEDALLSTLVGSTQ